VAFLLKPIFYTAIFLIHLLQGNFKPNLYPNFESMQEPLQISPEFQLAFQYVTQTKQSIFLTGKAGTGKTTFLQHLKFNCPKNMIVAAPTGVASINAGGTTLHSLFSLPFQPYIPAKRGWGAQAEVVDRDDLLGKLHYRKDKLKLLRNMELLIIDEISMVRADVLDAIDVILRHVRRKHQLPFGGVQLLLIGDIFQLPPVARQQEWDILREYYASEFFFDSKVMQEVQPVCVQLETIYRQSDLNFIDLLNKVRNNIAAPQDLELLNSRAHSGRLPDNCITLTTHNKTADEINVKQLEKLHSNAYKFSATVNGSFPEFSYPAESDLILKVGARVMFIKNDSGTNRKFFNGKIGQVISIEDDTISVQCPGDEYPIDVERHTWRNVSFRANAQNNSVEEDELGAFSQYPLRLAWAVTIHKSQGLTFDQCAIDAALSFAGGQLYVALSRCRSFEGLHLLSKIGPSALRVHPAVIGYFNELHPDRASADFGLEQMKYAEELLLQVYEYKEEHTLMLQISNLLQDNRMNFSAQNAETIHMWYSNINELKKVGEKFALQINALIRTAPPENNPALQERIIAANQFFLPKIDFILGTFLQHGISLDSKMISSDLSPLLDDLHNLLCVKAHFYKSNKPFSAANFFANREEFVRPHFNSSTYAASTKAYAPKDVDHPALYASLAEMRNNLVQETGKEVYSIANNVSLKEMSNYLPLTKNDLLNITGFGNIKVAQFGQLFLDIILEYALMYGFKTKMQDHPKVGKAKAQTAKSEEKAIIKKARAENGISETVKTSIDLVGDGMSVEEVAKQRGFTVETIYGHVATGLEAGKISIDKVLTNQQSTDLLAMIKANPDADLKGLKEIAGAKYGFGQLKLGLVETRRREMM
jgi:PIF1-like helicase/Helix-turn-helix domain/HRDC domain